MRTIQSPRGFTLIEVAFVLLIAAVVLSMTFVAFGAFSARAAARGAAQTFSSDLRQARSFAVRTRDGVKFTFKEDSSLYRAVTDGGDTIAQRYFDGRGEFRIDSLRIPYRGDTIRFNSDGALDFDAMRVTSGSAIFSAGGISYQVTFNATGSSVVSEISN